MLNIIKKLLILTIGLSSLAFATDVNDLTKKAKNGDIQAQWDLFDYYKDIQDEKNMFYWTKELASQGEVNAITNLGIMYYTGTGVRQDYHQAFKYYVISANQGEAKAQNNLGVMYSKGQGVKQDYQKAFEWHMKSANQGHPKAQNSIGVMYFNGEGVKKNHKIANEWFKKACDNGDRLGCKNYQSFK